MQMDPQEVFYAAWQPVEINAGDPPSPPLGGFWINGTGLQWSELPFTLLSLRSHDRLITFPASDTNAGPGFSGNFFGGWLLCDWCMCFSVTV